EIRVVWFMACFRFKLWWIAQRMGDKGGDVPRETQFLLVESKAADAGGEDDAWYYVVFLPLVEGAFRGSLQGGAGDALELCVESGDAETRAASFERAHFADAAESDPFAAVAGAVAAARSCLRTFRLRTEKRLPGIVDCFGWCTWDAFYRDVTQDGVQAGLRSLVAGGAPPKFVIIDDGWQSVATDDDAATAADGSVLLLQQQRDAVPGDLAGRRGERPRDGGDGLDHGVGSCPRALLRRAARVPRRRRTAVVWASEDFLPRDPVSHTIHVASTAYNSVFLGEFMLPDWDMFHSLHPAAEYHGSARAISGGPIYVRLFN
ncbi:hypothetical protein EJB05_28536, partial [Eragrostis curvula]